MKRVAITDEEMKQEIERLRNSPEVKAQRKFENRRQRLYTLRWQYKQGQKILQEQEGK